MNDSTLADSTSWETPTTRRMIFWLGCMLGLLFIFNQIFLGQGYLLDDEMGHYWISRSVWVNPTLIFDAWTRPGRNLMQFLPTPLGLHATRLFTIGMLFVGLAATVSVAKVLGIRRTYAIPLAFMMQPWVVELGGYVLTQTPFLLVWILAVWCDFKKRDVSAGLLFGYLGLVRHEGAALTGLYFLLVLLRSRQFSERRCKGGLVVIVPFAILNVSAWFCSIPMPIEVFFHPKPTTMYGSGSLFHFVKPTFYSVGLSVAILFGLGMPKLIKACCQYPVLLTYPAYFGAHTIIYWKGLFASGGYVYFLMPMCPFFAVGATFGLDTLLDSIRIRRYAKTAACCLAFIAICQSWTLPHRLWHSTPHNKNANMADAAWRMLNGYRLNKDDHKVALDETLEWLHNNPDHPPLLCFHTYFRMKAGMLNTKNVQQIFQAMEKPVWLIWESKYTPLIYLEGSIDDWKAKGWEVVKDFGQKRVAILSNESLLKSQNGTRHGNWWVARSNGTNSFTNEYFGSWDPKAGWNNVRTGDFNNDGLTDVAGRSSTGQLWVGLNTGSSFNTQLWGYLVPSLGIQSLMVADVDNDGDDDMVGRSSSGQWWVARSNGSSNFANELWGGWVESAGWNNVMVADLNADGNEDIIGQADNGQWWAAQSTGSAFTTEYWGYWLPSLGWQDVQVTDVDSDGDSDLVGRTTTGDWWVARSNGSNGFTNEWWGGWVESAGWDNVLITDLDGDGNQDIIGQATNGQWWASRSNGSSFATEYWGYWIPSQDWRDVHVIDVDQDGNLDLVGRTASNAVWVARSNGSNGFTNELWGVLAAGNWTIVMVDNTVGGNNAGQTALITFDSELESSVFD